MRDLRSHPVAACRVRVGLVKAEARPGDLEHNLGMLDNLLRPLAGEGLDMVVTPECFLDGYMVRGDCTPARLRECCVTGADDPMIRRIGERARSLRSWLIFGASVLDPDGTLRNAAYLIDRQGEVRGRYCKLMVNTRFYTPGNELPVYATDFATMGIVICADRRWPEHIRCLRLRGAEVVFNPTWGMHGEFNDCLMRVRAYENGIPVCFAHPRQALICLPDGSVAANMEGPDPAVLVHDIDVSGIIPMTNTDDKSATAPIRNRRPELYGPLVESLMSSQPRTRNVRNV